MVGRLLLLLVLAVALNIAIAWVSGFRAQQSFSNRSMLDAWGMFSPDEPSSYARWTIGAHHAFACDVYVSSWTEASFGRAIRVNYGHLPQLPSPELPDEAMQLLQPSGNAPATPWSSCTLVEQGWPLRAVRGRSTNVGSTTVDGAITVGEQQHLLAFQPLWPGLALNVLIFFLALCSIYIAACNTRRRLRRARGRCRRCGHILAELSTCPECGCSA